MRLPRACPLLPVVFLTAFALAAPLSLPARGATLEDARAALEGGDFAAGITMLAALAESGNAQAQTALASHYRLGEGVPQDFAAAARWYREAAAQGDADAQNALGLLLAAGLGVEADAEEAVRWYHLAAEQGDPAHQFDLALMYDNGIGVEEDRAAAAEWYAKAAEQGFADAEANLGLLYHQGMGVAKDLARALALYTSAAEKGNVRAQNNLALLYTRGEGVPQDYETAVHWFTAAAEQGFAPAMNNLGVMYDNGFGVAQSDAEAIRWYRAAGTQDATDARSLTENATPVWDPRLEPPATEAEALRAYEATAKRGDPVAQFILAYLLSQGLGTDPAPRAAAHWYGEAAERGLAPAMANLGLLYIKGIGVPQDYVLGYMWTNLAAAGGVAEAAELRDALSREMTPEQINEAQEMSAERWRETTARSVHNP